MACILRMQDTDYFKFQIVGISGTLWVYYKHLNPTNKCCVGVFSVCVYVCVCLSLH